MLDLNVIKERRNKLGLSRAAVAEKVGVTRAHYSQVEKGQRGLSIETLEAILKVLDLWITDVWVDERGTPPVKESEQPTPIIVERNKGGEIVIYKLPPVPESFRLVEMGLIPGADSDLTTIADAWDNLEDEAKARILDLVQS